jgi:phosphate transport system substrate-binding protein
MGHSDFIVHTNNTYFSKTMLRENLRIIKFQVVCLFTLFLFIYGCSENGGKALDTPVSGKIVIGVDENFKPVIEGQLDTFQSIYNKTKIVPHYIPETEAFQMLMDDSVRLIIVTRKLNETELNYFKNKTLTPRQNKIANDAIALIVNPDNTDTLLKYATLSEIFSGKINTWKGLNSSSNLEDINIVFDNKNSGTARYIKEKCFK